MLHESLPNIGLLFGLHHRTEAMFGFGASVVAVVDAAARLSPASPGRFVAVS